MTSPGFWEAGREQQWETSYSTALGWAWLFWRSPVRSSPALQRIWPRYRLCMLTWHVHKVLPHCALPEWVLRCSYGHREEKMGEHCGRHWRLASGPVSPFPAAVTFVCHESFRLSLHGLEGPFLFLFRVRGSPGTSRSFSCSFLFRATPWWWEQELLTWVLVTSGDFLIPSRNLKGSKVGGGEGPLSSRAVAQHERSLDPQHP